MPGNKAFPRPSRRGRNHRNCIGGAALLRRFLDSNHYNDVPVIPGPRAGGEREAREPGSMDTKV